jgi:hypothetical protein
MNRQCFLTNPTRMAIFVLVTLSAAGYSAEIRREGDFLGTLRQEDPTSREESYAVSFTMARQASLGGQGGQTYTFHFLPTGTMESAAPEDFHARLKAELPTWGDYGVKSSLFIIRWRKNGGGSGEGSRPPPSHDAS